MEPNTIKRQVDFQVIARWVEEGARVLDLGCGRGILLEYLKQKKSIYGVGVDVNFDYILSCVKRGVTAYHGDIRKLLATFDEDAFDRVIFSRSVEFVDSPEIILNEGLRVGKRVTVGFVNFGSWLHRWRFLLRGESTINDMRMRPWYETPRSNPFSIKEFDSFCNQRDIQIKNREYLSGDLKTGVSFLPRVFSGYAIYDLSKK